MISSGEQTYIVHSSVRDIHNPYTNRLKNSRFLLKRDVKDVLSVDRYVWPIRQELDESADFEQIRLDGGLTIVAVCISESELGDVRELGILRNSSQLKLLGFDIADLTLISGLTDCEYKETEIEELGRLWAARLNEWHLFGNHENASLFKELCNKRVPEHAPFVVYQLWSRVESGGLKRDTL